MNGNNGQHGEWVCLCKRTDDPKLAWIERTLAQRGIPSRRNGFSFHAPILEVPVTHEEEAWNLMLSPARGSLRVDDLDDDDPMFTEEP